MEATPHESQALKGWRQRNLDGPKCSDDLQMTMSTAAIRRTWIAVGALTALALHIA